MPRITSKGQVTIPKRIRDHLGLKTGSQVAFRHSKDGKVTVEAQGHTAGASRFAALRGTLAPGMNADDLMRMTRGWGEPDREGR